MSRQRAATDSKRRMRCRTNSSQSEASLARIVSVSVIAIVAAARETGGIVTVEEALVTGLGGAVAEVVVRRHPASMRFVGVPDTFAPTGSVQWLLDHFGINAEGVAAAARDLLAD